MCGYGRRLRSLFFSLHAKLELLCLVCIVFVLAMSDRRDIYIDINMCDRPLISSAHFARTRLWYISRTCCSCDAESGSGVRAGRGGRPAGPGDECAAAVAIRIVRIDDCEACCS
jgi:hypothetical protein